MNGMKYVILNVVRNLSYSAALCSLLFMLLMASCEHRPLIEPTTRVKIRLVTEGIHNVTCDIYNESVKRPEITSNMMRIFLYDATGQQLFTQMFTNEKTVDDQGCEVLSRLISLSSGDYRLLSYNFDLDGTYVADEGKYDRIYAYTHEIPSSLYSRFGSRADNVGPVYYEPEHVMVARKTDLKVLPDKVLAEVEMDAHTVVHTYYIQIRISGVGTLASKANAQAILSGLSKASMLGEGKPVEEPVSIYFEMQKGIDPKIEDENLHVLCAVFNTFGRLEEVPSNLKITITVLARNGETFQKEVDMTPIFQTEDARLRHWLLIDEVWEIPEIIEEEGQGGFKPKVDAWEDVEETLAI